jgi:hypothetical protein
MRNPYRYLIKVQYSLENKKEYLYKDFEQAKRDYENLCSNTVSSARFLEDINYGTNEPACWRKCTD